NNSIRTDLSFSFAIRIYIGHDRSGSPGRKALIIISRGEIKLSSTTDHFVWQKSCLLDIYFGLFSLRMYFFLSVRSIRGLSITVKCAVRDGFTGNSANWIAPYISIQQMKIDSDALPLITARRIATPESIYTPTSRPIVHVNIEKRDESRVCDIKPEFKRTNRRLRCLAQRRTVPRHTRVEERNYKMHCPF
ncbi:hypothetical protein ALC56_09166, partial [Trachymyrmex septentrionalis]